MDTIKIPVQAYILNLFPENVRGRSLSDTRQPATDGRGQQLQALANGLAVPSFWTADDITEAVAGANAVWAQAKIEFTPVAISKRSESVPADENGMWIAFVNRLRPRTGIAVGFVYDLPSDEGGWGGGRIAIVSGQKVEGSIAGFAGRILAHELGHVLFDTPEHEGASSNLMFGRRHPRVVTADLLEGWQIEKARRRAASF
jgi:hypothetical protein